MNEACGVLALQGDYAQHCRILELCGVPSLEVRSPEDLSRCKRLILPGGESTTIYRLLLQAGLWQPLQQRIQAGMPTFGTCAGMILLAQEVAGQDSKSLQNYGPQPCLAGIDVSVNRNAYGRQIASFSTELDRAQLAEALSQNNSPQGKRQEKETQPSETNPLAQFLEQHPEYLPAKLPLVFIRAPQVVSWSEEVQVLLHHQGQAICLQQGKVLVCSFHPELGEETLIHRYFLQVLS